ncbi:hypothetical protein [Flavobacterium hercynium]|uniref:Lipoprotein n=1 Tax=Flavobacterium hercynium TaxID=387094 RepID=A0A226HQ19_9FLAO|nr:hypothetical protein [Flavobacterium hercynium]OXA96222.1 hypothetical protein B0A66_01205 [Flavobacterium hercynium]SMP05042.1 hypothetical protein SAMN06265346_101468 [Flavobacterium hercynium]
MIKKLLLLSVVLSQLAVSCSSDDNTDPVKEDPTTEEPVKPTPELTLEEQVAAILKQPYSTLPPAEQKVKLEAEANEMLVQLDKTKGSSAIEAIENLSNLIAINPVDIFGGKNGNSIEEILNVADVYGIYTWNNTNNTWVKTASTTELKFVFPAKASLTSNNAVLTSKSVASNVKIKFTDIYGGYDYVNDKEIDPVFDQFYLPTSTDASLTIDGTQAATITQTAAYSNGKQAPDTFNYKITLNDGYVWEMSGKKGTASTSTASLTFNGKSLLAFTAGSSANIDGLLSEEQLSSYRGKANALITLMDNFIIVADMDLATDAADDLALESLKFPNQPYYDDPNADYKAYYNGKNTYYKNYSTASAASFNKNIKLTLISKKEGTKIADIIIRSEEGSFYNDRLPVWTTDDYYGAKPYWSYSNDGEEFKIQYYEENYYLKFSDQTQVAMSAYFSEGFETFEKKFEEFIKGFERK